MHCPSLTNILTSVCNISHCFSSVQENIYCIAIYFCFLITEWERFWKISFNSVINKLNLILQPLVCLLICWLPNDSQVREL